MPYPIAFFHTCNLLSFDRYSFAERPAHNICLLFYAIFAFLCTRPFQFLSLHTSISFTSPLDHLSFGRCISIVLSCTHALSNTCRTTINTSHPPNDYHLFSLIQSLPIHTTTDKVTGLPAKHGAQLQLLIKKEYALEAGGKTIKTVVKTVTSAPDPQILDLAVMVTHQLQQNAETYPRELFSRVAHVFRTKFKYVSFLPVSFQLANLTILTTHDRFCCNMII
jgi:hypothetical protein